MGTKIDRVLHLVVREGAERDEPPERFIVGRPGLIGAALVAASLLAWSWIGTYAAIGLGVGMTMMRASLLRPALKLTTVTRKARVEISSAGIKAVGDPFLPRAEIAQAYFQPRGELRPTIRCVDRRRTLLFEAEVADEAEGQELLAALGHDASQARSRFRVGGPLLQTYGGPPVVAAVVLGLFFLALWLAGRGAGAAVAALPVVLAALFIGGIGIGRTVDVGVDGVLVTWLHRKRFLRFETIEAVTTSARAVELRLRDGEIVRLPVPDARASVRVAALDVGALAARIEEARRAHARSAGARELALAVARGERRVAEWRAELERMHDPETHGGYRTPGARGEDLWRVVEDPTAPEDARAGAGMALRKEDGAQPRLRIAAEAVASPTLRVALERAADPAADEATLDEALEAFASPREHRES